MGLGQLRRSIFDGAVAGASALVGGSLYLVPRRPSMLSVLGMSTPIIAPGPICAEGLADSVSGVNLGKQLASEEQVSSLQNGDGEVIAGPNARVPLRDAPRLAATYGGEPQDWVKITSPHYDPVSGSGFETHAYMNTETGEVVELKTKLDQWWRIWMRSSRS